MERNSNIVLFPKSRRTKIELTNCQYCTELLTSDNWSKSNQSYRRYVCKPCWNSRQAQYTQNAIEKDPNYLDKKKDRTKKWVDSFSEERKELEAKKRYNRWIKRKYGISLSEYNELLSKQGNKCAICKGEPSGKGLFHVDHCHSSGIVRGLLCHSCNFLLGNSKDDTSILLNAIHYLNQNRADHKIENRVKEGGKKF